MNESDIDSAIQLARGHDWIPLSALAVGALVRLAKSDQAVKFFPVAIAPLWRSWAAVILGVLFGVVHRLAAGGTWGEAIVGGVAVGITAISGHELIVESIRKGRDIGIAKQPPPPPGSLPPPQKPLSIKPPAQQVTILEMPPPPGPMTLSVLKNNTFFNCALARRDETRARGQLIALALIGLMTLIGCRPIVAEAEQAHDLTVGEVACRAKGVSIARGGGTCAQRRAALQHLAAYDPDCLVLYGDAGPGDFTCRDAGAGGDGGPE
jgi:hypothetical protein